MDNYSRMEQAKVKQKTHKGLYVLLFLICFIMAFGVATAKAESVDVVSRAAALGEYKEKFEAFEIKGFHQGSVVKGKVIRLPQTCLTESPVMEHQGQFYLKVDTSAVQPLKDDDRHFTYQFVLVDNKVVQLKILDVLMGETVSVWKDNAMDTKRYAFNDEAAK